ncbi:MAG TPA: ATP-binding protein [Acidimicrobiales bacterium]|nr:ATP-binding protein [Acidimicrobiales bacterium]
MRQLVMVGRGHESANRRQFPFPVLELIRPLRRDQRSGDPVVAATMIDRFVHYAEVVNLKGDSYRLKDRDMGRMTTNEES